MDEKFETFEEYWSHWSSLYLSEEGSESLFESIAEKAWQAAQPQWQPIETAPKLGERFLVHCEGGHLEVAFNLRGKIIGDSGSNTLTLKDKGYKPTHWMPLPPPPQQ